MKVKESKAPDFVIGEITKEVPSSSWENSNTKYKEVFENARKLNKDEWLTVTFSTNRLAASFRANVVHKGKFKAKQRKNIVYISNKEE